MFTLREKIGQLMMVGFDGVVAPPHILRWLESGRIGGVYLFARNIDTPAQVRRLIDSCRAAAEHPILVGIDQEGGTVARLRAGFSESPGALALAASGEPQLAEDVATMLGVEMAALGINWNFAPVADLAHNRENPSVGTRSLSKDATLAGEFVAAQVRGFQRAGIAATVKHFPGLGNTVIDTHVALARVSGSLDYLYRQDLLPFRRAIDDDVACVMVTHVMFEAMDNRFPASLSPRVISGLLREELRYGGAVCSDCMEMKAITNGWGAGEAAVLSLLAGVDMPLYSHSRKRQSDAYEAVLGAAETGRIPISRIDESVARIQALKRRFDLPARPPLNVVDCPEHRALAQKAARAGTVLIRDSGVLPIRSDSRSIACIEFAPQVAPTAVKPGSPSAFARYLRERLPGIECKTIGRPNTVDSAASELAERETLILATRNAHLSPPQLKSAQSLIVRFRQVILVCLRNPYDAGALTGADAIICVNGDGNPSLKAAVDALCGDYLPAGNLTVSLN